MSPILALLLLLAPQEDESKRVRETVLGLPGLEAKAPVEKAQEVKPPASFTTPRVKRGTDDYKTLLDHNVFSPPRKKEAPKSDKDGPKAPEGPKTRTWVLTGIVFNTLEKRYEALIEDPASPKESKYLKPGDAVAGVTITEVTFDQVSYKRGETAGVLKLQEKLTETLAAGIAAPSTPEEQAEIDKTRERMKKRNKREVVPDEAEDDAETKKKPKQS
ncbi:MAG TPA: hypothetical protein VJU16_03485 [Planctomycetota bacterium]|nr:hypothetical protein [Planctomycetota bacterium]